MNDNRYERVSNEIAEIVNTGNYDFALSLLKDDETRSILIQGAGDVFDKFFDCANATISNVAKEHYDATVKIYAQACACEVMRQARELDSKDRALESFMNFANNLCAKIDMKDTVAVDNALRLIDCTKNEISKAMDSTKNASVLDVLKSWNIRFKRH